MRRLAVLFSFAVALVALAAPFGPAWAQIETGRISGTVADAQGGVVPGVTVTAKSVNTGVSRDTVSDTNGGYLFANVNADTYEVTFMLTGFKTAARRVTVSVGATAAVDVKLEVGGLTEQVSVIAVPETIDTRTGEFKTTISARQLSELPTLTRNPYDLVALSGNVKEANSDEGALVGGEQGGRGTGFSINGARTASTNIMLDGGDNNYLFTAGIGQEIPLDAVQEFSVITNNFSAQYGRASGGIVNLVTKSGTNRVTGTGYEFFRNEKLASNSPDNIANDKEKDTFKRSQLGYSVGGPIVKDRVHFFSSLEYIGIRSQTTMNSWVLTPEFLAQAPATVKNYFASYGSGAVINGPILSRADVTSKLNIGAGAFNNLPAGLPVFGRADILIPTDGGGGFPQNNYQTVNKVDFSVNNKTQANVIFALQRVDAFVGTQSQSPYPQYNSGSAERKYNVNASTTRVWSNNFTSQSKLVWNKLTEEQPVDRVPEPRLAMNPSGPVRIDGYRIAFPGYLPFNPGNDIPSGGPQQLTQFYQDQTWLKGAHDIRFGGSYVHIADDHTFSAYSNAIEALSSSNNATTSMNNLAVGQIARFQKAINPKGFPGGTYVTPVDFPSFLSKNRYSEYAFYANDNWSVGNRVKLNLGMRYEYFGPQTKSDPKYDSNFYWGDPNLNIETATPQQIIDSVRTGSAQPSNTSPVGGLWNPDKNNFAPRLGFAWDVFGDGRTAVRGGYGMAYERNFGNVTYNVLFNPPLYLVATIDNTDLPGGVQQIYTDNAGPFGGVAGVTKTIPTGSLRHVDQNIKTAYSHIYGVSVTKDIAGLLTGSVEYNGSSGRNLYDLSDVNRRGMPLVYEGVGTATTRPNSQYTAFNTRGNRGRSQYHGVVFSADSRQFGDTGLALTSKYTVSNAKDNLSGTFSDADNNGYFNLGYLDPFDPMLDYGHAGFDVRHRFSASAIWSVPFGGSNPWLGGWQVNALFTARSGYPFSVFDCTNALDLCIRALDPTGIERTVNESTATGNPNEYDLLDISGLAPYAGSYVNPLTGTSDYGPYPASMTKRNDFYGPGAWNVDFIIGKRFRFGNKAALLRLEAYNLFNHANMYAHTDIAQIDSVTSITGAKDDFRRMQLGFKFEF
ncbi:MAG TPA: carboxypeptidase regulatory-like domain-containing protein [Vicinamibacterales bacterium]|jgi:outer membrane receptor protein involved in Fe transport|nr:carboxypeptidase regulatory-like domain-containing protein [Vicinamibacterales bacterium]